jgi:hypothetical protein
MTMEKRCAGVPGGGRIRRRIPAIPDENSFEGWHKPRFRSVSAMLEPKRLIRLE